MTQSARSTRGRWSRRFTFYGSAHQLWMYGVLAANFSRKAPWMDQILFNYWMMLCFVGTWKRFSYLPELQECYGCAETK